ncbi:DNA polymerase delta subunit 2-like [Panonychus citri]|uniref:DNA polymerase delta subunit 2-like n=1 Tax=Panonychus citri TaxID=50023 RepID=UPI002307B6E2|nr:DNA polymerase delta subunit 2-like [Panonychus citri]
MFPLACALYAFLVRLKYKSIKRVNEGKQKSASSQLLLFLFVIELCYFLIIMTNDSNQSDLHVKRSRVEYQDLCDIFRVKVKQFSSQYFPFYLARLRTIRPLVLKSIESTWGDGVKVVKMSELVDHVDQKVIITGVLFKNMAKQPTILKEIASEENQDALPLTQQDNYIDDADYLMLQDENECVKLHGKLSVDSHVTGVVIGLMGFASDEGNEFSVEDYCYPMLPDPWSKCPNSNEDKYVLLVSGLGFSRNLSSKLKSSLDLLSDYLVGLLDPEEDDRKPARIIRLIIVGNLIGENVRAEEEAKDETLKKPWLRKSKPFTVEIMSTIDDYLVELGKSIEIEIMPGYTDVTNSSLPQQPIHPSILPRSSVLSAIRSVTNPYVGSFDSRLFIGNSGQPIDNIRQFSDLKDSVDIMEKTIHWSHMAPTAPDTLHGYSDPNYDPFVLTHLPDVYFTGNQEKFSTKVKKINENHPIRFISVPKFEKSFSAVQLNLKNLSCQLITFT